MEPLLADQAKEVVARFKLGQLTYDECREALIPVLERMNAKGREIAKRYGRKHRDFSATSMMR